MKREGRRPTGVRTYFPLKHQWFHILLALSEDAKHGAEIVRSVLAATDGTLRLWPATLYGSLDDLCGHGWIQELTDERPVGESEKKRFYRITPAGARILATDANRLQSLARKALKRVASGNLIP